RAALAGRGVAVDTEVLGLQRLRKTRYFRELSAAAGIQHSLMAYVRWRNDVVAAVMLGRSSAFSARDLRRIESALPALGLGRAAFSLPWVSAPLRDAREPALLARLGLERQSRPLDSVCTPSGKLVVQDRRGFREMVAIEG